MRVSGWLARGLMLGWVAMAAGLQAQTVADAGSAPKAEANDTGAPKRSFTLVLGTQVESVRMYWNGGDAMDSYAHAHPGRYIVFVQDGVLHRLDNEGAVHEMEAVYAPMQALAARQKALAAEQKPLSEQQRALSAEMRGASTPVEMQRIGAAQGSLGRQQGEIGRRQGEIGRQQGALGRALNEKVQPLLDVCLRDGSCPAVAR